MHDVLLHTLQLWVALAIHPEAVNVDVVSTIQRKQGDAVAPHLQDIAQVMSVITATGQALLRGLYDQDITKASVSPPT
jgi:hypothetical protein